MAPRTVRPQPEPSTARAWVVTAIALGAGSLMVAGLGLTGWGGAPLDPTALNSRLAWAPSAAAEPWRWWTAAWVHLSGLHLAANLAGLALLAALGRAGRLSGDAALAWALAWPLTHLLLLLQPDLVAYGGLSGVLHAGVACAGVSLLAPSGRVRGQRFVGWAVLGVLALKILSEAPGSGAVVRSVPGWDVPVAPVAHACGALAGLLASAVVWAVRAWTRRRRTASVRAE